MDSISGYVILNLIQIKYRKFKMPAQRLFVTIMLMLIVEGDTS